MSFSVISLFFLFWWVSKISSFWQLGPKSAHPKNTIKIGVSARHFLKTDVRHETAILTSEIPVSFFFAPCFAETPIFIVF